MRPIAYNRIYHLSNERLFWFWLRYLNFHQWKITTPLNHQSGQYLLQPRIHQDFDQPETSQDSHLNQSGKKVLEEWTVCGFYTGWFVRYRRREFGQERWKVSRYYILKKVIVLVILCRIIRLNYMRLPCTVSCVGKALFIYYVISLKGGLGIVQISCHHFKGRRRDCSNIMSSLDGDRFCQSIT